VSVELRDGVVFIEPAAGKVRIVKRRRLWVAEQIESSEPLSLDTVNAVRDQVRKR
jgi:hypothetical protein